MSNLGNPNNGSSGSRHTELQALVDILRQLKKPSLAVGSATEATLLLIEATLNSIESETQNITIAQTDLFNLMSRSNWTSSLGNSVEYTYYAGVEAGNPSGTTTNVKTVVYKTGVTTIFTQTIAYNAADLAISIVTT
jgi:hypothetical protein